MALEPHQASALRIAMNNCAYFEKRYPVLRELELDVRPETANMALKLYIEHIKLIDQTAGVLTLMEMYRELAKLPQASGLRNGPVRALARLYNERGLAHHVAKLVDSTDPLYAEAENLIRQHDDAYGVKLNIHNYAGLTRGNTVLYYLAAHPKLLKGRHVAHVGPERECRAWITDRIESLECTYTTIDGFQPGMDRYEDLSEMMAENDSFDTIICHRVLEHVINGAAAHKELYRVLKPGGVLNISVPEVLYLKETSEWVIPDPGFHDHVRAYGRDFSSQLEAVGFRVDRADWLLHRPFEELRAVKAYPMLMYNAYKD